jgi:hypothetical protein
MQLKLESGDCGIPLGRRGKWHFCGVRKLLTSGDMAPPKEQRNAIAAHRLEFCSISI